MKYARSLTAISCKPLEKSTFAASSAATDSCSCRKIWSCALRRVFPKGACLILLSSDLFNTSTSARDSVSDPIWHVSSPFFAFSLNDITWNLVLWCSIHFNLSNVFFYISIKEWQDLPSTLSDKRDIYRASRSSPCLNFRYSHFFQKKELDRLRILQEFIFSQRLAS